jgi:hypothetical protein
MTKPLLRVGAITLALALAVVTVPLKAQFVVYDPTNYIEAVLQYEQLIRHYEFLIQQAKRVPVDAPLVVLTPEGKALLDAHVDAGGARQQYHQGLVKPRELGHDVQLYRLYQMEAARLEHDGGRIARVVLDYELKRDYQTFLHRKDRPEGASRETDLQTFADARQLPIIDGHLELPDLRIEYETEDGRVEHRDVELVTEHYSRGHLAGKAQAGFALYRAAGAGGAHGGSTRTGGTPLDPHHLEALL